MPKFALLLVATIGLTIRSSAQEWKLVPGAFPQTRWAKDVSPDKVRRFITFAVSDLTI